MNLNEILSPREEKVVRMFTGFPFPPEDIVTLEQVGQEFEITKERIKQIENKILKEINESKIIA